MVYNGQPLLKMDDLGGFTPLFLIRSLPVQNHPFPSNPSDHPIPTNHRASRPSSVATRADRPLDPWRLTRHRPIPRPPGGSLCRRGWIPREKQKILRFGSERNKWWDFEKTQGKEFGFF